ncbi:MAG: hypothetical protein M1343_08435 [Chloroflexi bacterium]|nr:hypothetical protein [Chloroflexota bacterium]
MALADLIARLRVQLQDVVPASYDFDDSAYTEFFNVGMDELNIRLNTAYTVDDFPVQWTAAVLCAAKIATVRALVHDTAKMISNSVQGQAVNVNELNRNFTAELALAQQQLETYLLAIEKWQQGTQSPYSAALLYQRSWARRNPRISRVENY